MELSPTPYVARRTCFSPLFLIICLFLSVGLAVAAVAPQPGDFQGCPEQGKAAILTSTA